MVGHVVAVARSERHEFTKPRVESIRLVAGLGVDGDAHSGRTVQHRSRVREDPTQPNLRQVHLIPSVDSPDSCCAGAIPLISRS